MGRGAGKPRRKNVNLSEGTFQKLEILKKKESKRLGIFVSWDVFFTRAVERGKL